MSYEIIVVDNASTDNSLDRLSRIEGIKLVKNNNNRGFTGGNNDGARIARGKYIVILNNDTIIYNSNINQLSVILDRHGKFDVAGGNIVGMDGELQPAGGYEPSFMNLFLQFTVLCYKYVNSPWIKKIDWSIKGRKEVDWASGCFFAMRLKTYAELGGFDENIFIYLDEVEFHKRLRDMGGRIYIYPDIVIHHYGQISWGANHYIGLRHNYNSAVYYLGKWQSYFHKYLFIFTVKMINLLYLPFFFLLRVFTLGKNQKLNNKLKFCLTLLAA